MAAVPGSLGAAVRRCRTTAGLSLRRLAASADVSPSFLSQVENDLTRPSIETLHRIARAAGTTAQALLADAAGEVAARGAQEVHVTRAGSGAALTQGADPVDGVVRSLVAGDVGFQAMEICGAPRTFGAPYQHGGSELLYVIEGPVEVQIGSTRHRLRDGDSITYPGTVPHRTRRLGASARLVIVTVGE